MGYKITPTAAITFLKLTLALSFTWPLSKGASKFQVIRFKTLRFLFCLNVIGLTVPTIYTLYNNDDYDLPKLTKLWCLLGAFIQVPLEISQCALQYDRFQYLISEMEHNLECAEEHERKIYQKYADRCVLFYAGSTLSVFLTAFGISIILPLANQAFPTDVIYPFNVNHKSVKTFIFVHQFLVMWQCFSTVCIGNFVGLFIWFSAARFEILSQQFRAVNGRYDIIVCLRQHIKLLRYSREVIISVRSVLMIIIIICTFCIIASGLTIVSPSSLADKVQFMILCIAALMEVYACAWPADHLMDAVSYKFPSTNIARAIYESLWYNQDLVFRKNMIFILLRSQTPMVVTVSSVLPPLSLHYYASYVSTAFSYLMTLRIVFVEDNTIKD